MLKQLFDSCPFWNHQEAVFINKYEIEQQIRLGAKQVVVYLSFNKGAAYIGHSRKLTRCLENVLWQMWAVWHLLVCSVHHGMPPADLITWHHGHQAFLRLYPKYPLPK